jgi:glycosyltransferase involved in cell wall biosynthesis
LKILIVTHSYPRWENDWSANFIESLCLSYVKSGIEVVLFLPNTPKWSRAVSDLKSVRIVLYNYFPIHKWQVLGYGNAIENDLKPSVLQIFLLPFLIICGSIRLSRLLRKEKSIDLIHSHWAFPNSIISIIGKAMSFKKEILVFSSFPGSDVTSLALMGKFGKFLLKKIIGKSEYFSCNSHDLSESLVAMGLPENKIDMVIYGVNSETIKFKEEARTRIRTLHGIGSNEKMLLMIGRFVAKKGFSTAFRSLKEISKNYPCFKMIVIGDGNLKDEYLKILENDGQSNRVVFTGSLPLNELYDYYSACDVFLMPSRKLPADGLNVTVVEAMACSRPVVASNVGGNELVVFDGENGFLFDEDNHQQLAEKVLVLMKDDMMAQKFGLISRSLVEEKFNWDSIAKHYIQNYQDLREKNVNQKN